MMMGEKVSSVDAERMNMLYKVFADEVFIAEAMKIAKYLSEMPTKGFALTKKVLNQSMNNTLETQLDLEEKYQIECGHSHDYKEGVSAFLEKRKPTFTGE